MVGSIDKKTPPVAPPRRSSLSFVPPPTPTVAEPSTETTSSSERTTPRHERSPSTIARPTAAVLSDGYRYQRVPMTRAQLSPSRSSSLLSPAERLAALQLVGSTLSESERRRERQRQPGHTWASPELRRVLVILLGFSVLSVLIVGIVFAVEFARNRDPRHSPPPPGPSFWNDAPTHQNGSASNVDRWGWWEWKDEPARGVAARWRSQSNQTTYPCSFTESGCAEYQRPEICCGNNTLCLKTDYSESGIYCCPKNATCTTTEEMLAQCPNDLQECPDTVGGGCCPVNATCTEEGCVIVLDEISLETGSATPYSTDEHSAGTRPSMTATRTTAEGVTTTSAGYPVESTSSGHSVPTAAPGDPTQPASGSFLGVGIPTATPTATTETTIWAVTTAETITQPKVGETAQETLADLDDSSADALFVQRRLMLG